MCGINAILQDERKGGSEMETPNTILNNLHLILTHLCDQISAVYNRDPVREREITRKYTLLYSATKLYRNIHTCLTRIVEDAHLDEVVLVHALIYISRLLQKRDFVITWYNIHRVLLTCILLADKSVEDDHSSSLDYARLSKTDLTHMNLMEADMLKRLHYNTVVLPKTYNKALKYLKTTWWFDGRMPVF
jgi:hypothetical protein